MAVAIYFFLVAAFFLGAVFFLATAFFGAVFFLALQIHPAADELLRVSASAALTFLAIAFFGPF